MASPGRRPLLLVEDEPDIRNSLRDLLADAGYPVLTAANGREALECLRTGAERPALILLDLMMPVMGGSTFLERLEQEPDDLVAIPVVVLSAAKDAATRHPATVGRIEKPIDLDELLDWVRRYCG
ncbi:MAG TPA: response regulator [Burkholderiales bacterium]